MARKKKKQRPVYRKGRSAFIKKLKSAAKKYDEFLEATQEKGETIKKEFDTAKGIIGKEFKKTGQLIESVRKPTANFFQKSSIGIRKGMMYRPTSGLTNTNQLTPKIYRKLPRLF